MTHYVINKSEELTELKEILYRNIRPESIDELLEKLLQARCA